MYSFPILEPEEIVDVLREMGAAVTEEDINKPNSHSFRQWCELFIIEILERIMLVALLVDKRLAKVDVVAAVAHHALS